jgi:hypothetical protein
MSAALSLSCGVVIPFQRSLRSCDLQLKLKPPKLRQRSVSNCTRLIIKQPIIVSSISNLLETYNDAPPTAKVAFKTGVYITGFGLALLVFPQAVIQFFSTSTR